LTVYVLWVRYGDTSGDDNYSLLGVYSKMSKVESAAKEEYEENRYWIDPTLYIEEYELDSGDYTNIWYNYNNQGWYREY